jgi:hypothetical protein
MLQLKRRFQVGLVFFCAVLIVGRLLSVSVFTEHQIHDALMRYSTSLGKLPPLQGRADLLSPVAGSGASTNLKTLPVLELFHRGASTSSNERPLA